MRSDNIMTGYILLDQKNPVYELLDQYYNFYNDIYKKTDKWVWG